MNFKKWLENILPEDIENIEITPDDLLNDKGFSASKGCSFIFTQNQKLYTGSREIMHIILMGYNPSWKDVEDMPAEDALFGRCGKIRYEGEQFFVVAFWEIESKLQGLIDPCINALKTKGFIPRNLPLVIATLHGNRVINKETSPWSMKKMPSKAWELLRNLHLIRGKEKQAAMKELGLGGQKPRPDAEHRWPLRPESFTQWLNKKNEL